MPRNAKGSRPTQRNVLSLKEQLALHTIILKRYVVSAMNNAEFALSINTDPEESKLFRAPVTASHISTAIEAADIPPNNPRRKSLDNLGDCLGLTARVQALEEQLKRLTDAMIAKGVLK